MTSSRWSRWMRAFLQSPRTRRYHPPVSPMLEINTLEDRSVPAVFTVVNVLDSGAGSLRDAIDQANKTPGFDRINFAIPTDPSIGQRFSIRVATGLPVITDPSGVSIDATTQRGFAEAGSVPIIEVTGSKIFATGQGSKSGFELGPTSANNVIRGFIINGSRLAGIHIDGSKDNIIVGNWIGTDINGRTGTDPTLPTVQNRFQLVIADGAQNNIVGGTVDANGNPLVDAGGQVIGGTIAQNRNVLSNTSELQAGSPIDSARQVGSGPGVRIQDFGTTGNLIQGNFIGTMADGVTPLPNINGIEITNGADSNMIGNPLRSDHQNLITFNRNDGVRLAPYPYPINTPFYNRLLPATLDTFSARYYSWDAPIIQLESTNGEFGRGGPGTKILINGTDLTSTQSVKVGGVNVPFTVISDTQVQITITDAVPLGNQLITLSTVGGTVTSSAPFEIVPPPAPVTLNISTNPTPRIGQRITLTGFGLTATNGITVGGIAVDLKTLRIDSDSSISFIIPDNVISGANLIVVSNITGSANVNINILPSITPVISNFLASSGPAGTTITLFGPAVGSFWATSKVEIAGVQAKSFEIDPTGERLRVVVPNLPAGTAGFVKVYTPGGTDDTTDLAPGQQKFTFTASSSPVISSITAGGPVGTVVGIGGSGLLFTTNIQFNGLSVLPSDIDIVSDTFVRVKVPLNATSGIVTLTTPFGIATTSPLQIPVFQVVAPPIPTIPSFVQSAVGPVGSLIRVNGRNLSGTSEIIVSTYSAGSLDGRGTDLASILPYDPVTNVEGFRYTAVDADVIVSATVNFSGFLSFRVPQLVGGYTGPVMFTAVTAGATPSLSQTFTPQRPPGYNLLNPTGSIFDRGQSSNSYIEVTTNGDPFVAVKLGERFVVTPAASPTVTGLSSSTVVRGNEPRFTNNYFEIDLNQLPAGAATNGILSITGTGFTGAQSITFDGPGAADFTTKNFQVVNDSLINVIVDDRVVLGTNYAIQVTTPAGFATSANTVQVRSVGGGVAPIAPTLTVANTNVTNVIQGQHITFTGTNLNSTKSVTFGGGTPARFRVLSNTQILVEVPVFAPPAYPLAGQAIVLSTEEGNTTFATQATINAPTTPVFTVNNQISDVFSGNSITSAVVGQRIRLNFAGPVTSSIGANAVIFGTSPTAAFGIDPVVTASKFSIEVTVPEGANGGVTVDGVGTGITISSYPTPSILPIISNDTGNPANAQIYANSIYNNGAGVDNGIDVYNGNLEPYPLEPVRIADLQDIDTGGGAHLTIALPPDPGSEPAFLQTYSSGANRVQNYPLLQITQSSFDRTEFATAMVTQPFRTYRIDYYINDVASTNRDAQSGQTYVGSSTISTDSQGNGSVKFTIDRFAGKSAPFAIGTPITATATDLTPGTTFEGGAIRPRADGTSRFSDIQFITASTGTISGFKFEDLNANGILDPGEPGLQGWTIQLDLDNNGTIDATTVTSKTGAYTFGPTTPGFNGLGVPNGTHRVLEVLQPGYIQTAAPGLITIINGETRANNNFLNTTVGVPPVIPPVAAGTISGRKFNDLNGNGIIDAGEPALSGWTIQLDINNDGSIEQTAVTDANGMYTFTGVVAGTHKLSEVLQSGWRIIKLPGTSSDGVVTLTSAVGLVNQDFLNQLVPVVPPVIPPVIPPVPVPPGFSIPTFVTSSGAGGYVTGYTVAKDGTSTATTSFQPFGAFSGEIRVATGDVDGDGTPDIIAGAGPGGGPRLTVLSGRNGTVLRDFFVYEPRYTGGIHVAAADFNGDGRVDLIAGADNGGGSRIRIFDGATNAILADFFTYEETFLGGVRVGAGDFNGDGTPDLIAGAGFGGGPRVTVFDGKNIAAGLGGNSTRLADFFAFEPTQRDGVYVTGGDVNADGLADLIVGAGPGGGPRVTVFDANQLIVNREPAPILNFFAFDPAWRTGVRVAAVDLNGDNNLDIVVGAGPGQGDQVKTYITGTFDGTVFTPTQIDNFYANGDLFSLTGVWVG